MAPASPRAPHGPLAILQLHGRFDGDCAKDARVVRLMNHWGGKARHDMLLERRSADHARAGLDHAVSVRFLDGPAFGIEGGPGRYMALAQLMRGYDLVLSFGWNAFDGVITERLLGLLMNLPPIVHHEDVLGEDEVGALGLSADFYRRAALPSAHALVVPSGRLAHVAIARWGEAAAHVHHIPDGIPVAAYSGKRLHGELPGLVDDGRLVVGASVDDAPPQMIDQLLKAVAPLRDKVRLLVLDAPGEGEALARRAAALGIADLLVPDALPKPRDYLGALDIFVMLALADPCPRALVEAMAAGLPVVATDAGDLADMLASSNRGFVVKPDDQKALADALARLASEADLRAAQGAANHRRAAQCFDEKVMFALYARLYGSAAGREGALL